MAESKEIQAVVGQPVQIVLQSMAGSTGYSWYLSELEGGLVLSGTSTYATGTGISPVNQVFDFLAVKAGTFKVGFQLLAPWRPAEPGDTESYEVKIDAPKESAADDIEAAMNGRAFIPASAVNVGAQVATPAAATVMKYAVPMSSPTATSMMDYAAPMAQSAAASVIYAAPMTQIPNVFASQPQVIYAAPMSQSMLGNFAMTTQPQVVYAAPMVQSAVTAQNAALYAAPMSQSAPGGLWPASQVVILYAAPVTRQAAGNFAMASQPQVVYAAPMSLSNMGGAAWTYSPVILYAAPMAQASSVQPLYATPIMPYAAPWTSMGQCC